MVSSNPTDVAIRLASRLFETNVAVNLINPTLGGSDDFLILGSSDFSAGYVFSFPGNRDSSSEVSRERKRMDAEGIYALSADFHDDGLGVTGFGFRNLEEVF